MASHFLFLSPPILILRCCLCNWGYWAPTIQILMALPRCTGRWVLSAADTLGRRKHCKSSFQWEVEGPPGCTCCCSRWVRGTQLFLVAAHKVVHLGTEQPLQTVGVRLCAFSRVQKLLGLEIWGMWVITVKGFPREVKVGLLSGWAVLWVSFLVHVGFVFLWLM